MKEDRQLHREHHCSMVMGWCDECLKVNEWAASVGVVGGYVGKKGGGG